MNSHLGSNVSLISGVFSKSEHVEFLKQVIDVDCDSEEKTEGIAYFCHEVNRAYCETLGDASQKPWKDAPDWQKQSAIKGVLFKIENPEAPPSASHESWLKEKEAAGWKYGPVKDEAKKEHPCFVLYDQLHPDQKRKDYLFQDTVELLYSLSNHCLNIG